MKTWKAILAVLVVFALGMLAGVLATNRFYQKRIHAFLRGQLTVAPELIVRQVDREFKLTPEQRAQVLTIITDTRQRLQKARAQSEPEVRTAFQDMETRFRDLLTPEQREKFEELAAQRKKLWQQYAPRVISNETKAPGS